MSGCSSENRPKILLSTQRLLNYTYRSVDLVVHVQKRVSVLDLAL